LFWPFLVIISLSFFSAWSYILLTRRLIKKKMNLKKNIYYIIILVCGIGILAWAGVKFLKKSNASGQTAQVSGQNSGQNPPNGSGGSWGGGRGGNRGNFQRVHGTVTSVSESTIVMKADDGSAKNITVASDTRITKMDNGQRTTLAVADVKVADEITVMTSDSSQSNISPRMIIIGAFTPPQRGSYSGGGNGADSSGDVQNNDSAPTGSSNSTQI
jgi:hypothetical protein